MFNLNLLKSKFKQAQTNFKHYIFSFQIVTNSTRDSIEHQQRASSGSANHNGEILVPSLSIRPVKQIAVADPHEQHIEPASLASLRHRLRHELRYKRRRLLVQHPSQRFRKQHGPGRRPSRRQLVLVHARVAAAAPREPLVVVNDHHPPQGRAIDLGQ